MIQLNSGRTSLGNLVFAPDINLNRSLEIANCQ